MGNCLFGGLGDDVNHDQVIKVITSNGGVMEFYAPITVECITDEFQGHGIFRSHDLFWKPLSHHEVLVAGESYYLLPLNTNTSTSSTTSTGIGGQIAQVGHIRSNSVPQSSLVVPYRMSFDMSTQSHHHHGMLKRSYTDVFSRGPYSRGGRGSSCGSVWKVKLVISPEQLLQILSQEGRTQELIESVRTVAKCGNGFSSFGFSDQWSLSSSRNASSNKDALSEI